MIESRSPGGPAARAADRQVEAPTDVRGTYAYCLLRAAAPDLEGLGEGLPGAGPVRLLAAGGDLWLVVSDVDLDTWGAASIEARLEDLEWVAERALAHERIVEHWVPTCEVLPMKLFTIFAGDDRAIAHVKAERERIERVLERVGGRLEWGVRIQLDRRAAEAAASTKADGDDDEGRPGTAFLLARKRRVEAGREAVRRARAAAEEAFATIAEVADDAVRKAPAPGTPQLLEAEFLVPSARRDRLEAAVESAAQRLAEFHCSLTLSGPWPPYHFLEPDRTAP